MVEGKVKTRRNKHLLQLYGTLGFLLLVVLLASKVYTIQTRCQKYALTYPPELVELATSLGMEPIGGEEFLNNIKMYGGQGLPYAFGVLTVGDTKQSRIPSSVIFWCQKSGKKYLVYAVDNQKDEEHYNYEVRSIISESELYGHDYDIDTSRGLVLYDGILGNTKDLSHFFYLDNRDERGPKDVFPEYSNGFLPIIMYTESSIAVLYYYNNRWLQYVEVDE